MQTIGPYALRDLLGAGAAGRVWRAFDQQGSQVTMAVLEGPAANDPQRRWQFSTTVEQARQSSPAGAPVSADLVGQQPWVAYQDDGGATAANIFAAMGVPCEPVAAQGGAPGQPVPGQPMSGQPFAGQQPPVGQPTPGQFAPGQPAPGQFVPGQFQPGQPLPQPVSGMPVSGQPMSGAPQQGSGADAEPPTTMIRPGGPGQFGVDASVQPQQGFGPGEQPGPGYAQAEPANPFEPVDPFNAGGPPAQNEVNPFSPQVPTSGAPAPFTPQSNAQFTPPQQQQDSPFTPQSAPPQQFPPGGHFEPEPEPKRRRTGLLIGLVILIVVLLGGGVGGAIYFTQGGGKPEDKQSASSTPSAGPTGKKGGGGEPTPATQKSAPSTPKHPGKEPTGAKGSWPASFATFGAGDKTKPMSKLAGLGFDFTTPADWTCTKKDQSTSYVSYYCGNEKKKIGGDVIVRQCGEPCDAAKKIKMRKDEEAFGLQWIRDGGGNSSYAEGKKVAAPDGSTGYGLVLLRYWHSKPGGKMDRQVVVRLTAPAASAADVQKVAGSVREKTQ